MLEALRGKKRESGEKGGPSNFSYHLILTLLTLFALRQPTPNYCVSTEYAIIPVYSVLVLPNRVVGPTEHFVSALETRQSFCRSIP